MKKINLFIVIAILGICWQAQGQNGVQLDWGHALGGSLSDIGRANAVDAAGNVYSTGYFQGTMDIDPGTGTLMVGSSTNSLGIFIQKLSPSGTLIWGKAIESEFGSTIGRTIRVDNSGNVYVGGVFL